MNIQDWPDTHGHGKYTDSHRDLSRTLEMRSSVVKIQMK